MDFEVFEMVAWGKDEKTGEYTEIEYERKGATASHDTTNSLEEAQTLIMGRIKWDACSHVTFGDKDGYIHLCGGRSWFYLIEVIKRIWGIALKELPQDHSKDMFDMELFTTPPLTNPN